MVDFDAFDVDQVWADTDAADGKAEYKPLPEGEYDCSCNEAVLTTVNGKNVIQYEFVVTTGEHEGRKVWHRSYLTPKAMPYSKRDLQTLGVNTAIPFARLSYELESAIDKNVSVGVGIDTFGDKPRNKVKYIKAKAQTSSEATAEDIPF